MRSCQGATEFVPGGKKCGLCGHKDNEIDVIGPGGQNGKWWAWGYPIRDGKNQG